MLLIRCQEVMEFEITASNISDKRVMAQSCIDLLSVKWRCALQLTDSP